MKDTAPKNNEAENKPKISLLPLDILSELLCPAYEHGLQKYHRESWRKGFKTSDMMDACLRHLISFYYDGENFDPEAFEIGIEKHHLGAAIFCLISAYNTLKYHPDLDDRRIK